MRDQDKTKEQLVSELTELGQRIAELETSEVDRERTEEMLQESEERFSLFMDYLPAIAFIKDEQGRTLYVNKYMNDVLGAKDWTGKTALELFPKDIAEAIVADDKKSLAEGDQIIIETIPDKHGINHIYQTHKFRIERSGKPTLLGGIALDITERKQAEEALRKSEERLRIAGIAAYDLIYEWDVTYDALKWFGDIDGLLGYEKGEISRDINAWLDLIHSDDRSKLESAVELHRTSTEPILYEYRVRHKDGIYRHWNDHGLPLLDDKGRPYKWIGVCTDITERKQAEGKLQRNQELFRQLVENIHQAFWLFDWEKQKVIYASPAYEEIWGRKVQDLLNRYDEWEESIYHEDRPYAAESFQKVIETGGGEPREYRVQRPDGTVRWISDKAFSIKNDEGKIYRVCGIAEDVTKRKRAEESLIESERNYREIFNATNDAVFVHNIETGAIVDVNQTMCEVFGYTYEEALKLDVGDLSQGEPPYTQEYARRWVNKTVEEGPQLFEWYAKRKNGELFWSETNLKHAVIGGQDRVLAVVRDITERKQAEEKIRQRAFEQEALRKAMLALTTTLDHDEVIDRILAQLQEVVPYDTASVQLFDEGCLRIVGGRGFPNLEELLGITFDPNRKDNPNREVVHTRSPFIVGDAPTLYAEFLQDPHAPANIRSWLGVPMLVGERLIGMIALDKSDLAFYTQKHAWLAEAFAAQAAIAIENSQLYEQARKEISERKQVEKERERLLVQIQEQARRVQQIIDTIPEGVLLLDANGQVVLTNPVAEQHLDTLSNAQVGDTITHLGDRPLTELLTSPPKGLWHEIAMDDKVFELIARPMENGPEPEDWVLVINDVTRQRQVEKRIQQQERLASIGQLAAGIAHDFNNIMATIVLYAQITAQMEGLPSRVRERMWTINQQAGHATKLIQQILDFGRRAVLERQPLDLALILKEHNNLLERTLPENIAVELTYEPGEYMVHADPTRMQQMITNLALNARDAMMMGGKLHIGLERIRVKLEQPPLLPEMETDEWMQVITVSDTGSGIPPDVLPHIFEPFFTTRAPMGSGLGLAQVHGIVGQHGGRIDVDTRAGEGTTFTIYLPALAVSSSEPVSIAALEELPMGQGEIIIVVEDNPVVREAVVESLEILNYRVQTAANGQEALAVLEQHGNKIDLLLSDVVMPGMGGKALLHALRERGLTIPMVMLTGHPLKKEMEELREQGMTDWLPKPPELEQLAKVVSRALGKDIAPLDSD